MLPRDDCWLCTVQWACPTCLSGVCAKTSMQTNRHVPQGIWLSLVNLTQPHSPIKGYFGQMSRGSLRVLVKCLRVCVFSVKQREIVVQDDTTDLFSTFSRQQRSVWVARQFRCALHILLQPTDCRSARRSQFDVLLFQNNFLTYLFSLCLTFSSSVHFHSLSFVHITSRFSPFVFVPLSMHLS